MSRLWVAAFALLGVACGEASEDADAGGSSGGSGAVTGGSGAGTGGSVTVGGSGGVNAPECDGIARDTGKTPAGEDACQVLLKIRERCNPDAETPEPSDSALEECYAGVDVTRVDGCFLTLYERERETCEGNDDWDYSVALAKANPQIVTPAGLACLQAHEEGCDADSEILSPLKDCFARSEECDTFDDLCGSVYTLAPAWSSKLPQCLTRPCAELESCLYDLIGTPDAARDYRQP